MEPERAFDDDFPVSEGAVRENLRLGCFLEVRVRVADPFDVVVRQLAVLFAEVLAQRFEPLGCVDKLDLPGAARRFPVGEHPYVSGDAGVVEHVQRQRDNGIQPVVFDQPTADVAFALAGVAGEKRRPVVDFRDAAAQVGIMAHLAGHVGQEKHLPIAGAGDEGVFRVVSVRDFETRIAHPLFAAHGFEVFLPTLAVRRIGEHESELLRREGVVR